MKKGAALCYLFFLKPDGVSSVTESKTDLNISSRTNARILSFHFFIGFSIRVRPWCIFLEWWSYFLENWLNISPVIENLYILYYWLLSSIIILISLKVIFVLFFDFYKDFYQADATTEYPFNVGFGPCHYNAINLFIHNCKFSNKNPFLFFTLMKLYCWLHQPESCENNLNCVRNCSFYLKSPAVYLLIYENIITVSFHYILWLLMLLLWVPGLSFKRLCVLVTCFPSII